MLLLGPLQVHPCMHRGVHRVAQCPGALYICNPSAGRARSLLRAKRRGNEEDDLYNVKLDGEDEWQNDDPGDALSRVKSAFGVVNGLAEGLADVVYQFVPEGTSRTVVNTGVKAGLVLLVLSLVQSVLSLVVTVGAVILVGYVAVRVWGNEDSSSASSSSRGPPAKTRRRGRDSDVVDVWFEELDRKNKPR